MEIESGGSLITRLSSIHRPKINNLDSNIFPNSGPYPKEIAEISGTEGVGKTTLLMNIMARVVLPLEYGGKNGMVLFLLTDHNFDIAKFNLILKKIINENDETLNETNVNGILQQSLEKLTIQRCFDGIQFELAILQLNEILSRNGQYCLLALDSIGAFYWTYHTEIMPNSYTTMDSYMKALLERLTQVVSSNSVVLVYTKPAYFVANNGSDVSASHRVNYKMELFIKDLDPPLNHTNSTTHWIYKVHIPQHNNPILQEYEFDYNGIITWKK